MMVDAKQLQVLVRWMLMRDAEEVLSIERASFADPWTGEGLAETLRQSDVIGIVAEHDGRMAGYMVYRLECETVRVLNLAVDPACRRRGVGGQMVLNRIERVKSRRRWTAAVREGNLGAQLFFASLGFRATTVVRDYFDGGEDAYDFGCTAIDFGWREKSLGVGLICGQGYEKGGE